MMQFFSSLSGMYFPVSQISSIGTLQDAASPATVPFHTVRLDDHGFEDFGVRVSKYEVERILASSMPVIPAEPGCMLATFHVLTNTGPEEWRANLTPIIAWRIVDGDPEPITIEDDWLRAKAYSAIKMPGGMLVDESGGVWETLEEFEESARGWVLADRAEANADTETNDNAA